MVRLALSFVSHLFIERFYYLLVTGVFVNKQKSFFRVLQWVILFLIKVILTLLFDYRGLVYYFFLLTKLFFFCCLSTVNKKLYLNAMRPLHKAIRLKGQNYDRTLDFLITHTISYCFCFSELFCQKIDLYRFATTVYARFGSEFW